MLTRPVLFITHRLRRHHFHIVPGGDSRWRRSKQTGTQPFVSQVHLVELDQARQGDLETRLDNEGGIYGGGGGRGGGINMMSDEARPVKIQLSHGVITVPEGYPLLLFF